MDEEYGIAYLTPWLEHHKKKLMDKGFTEEEVGSCLLLLVSELYETLKEIENE